MKKMFLFVILSFSLMAEDKSLILLLLDGARPDYLQELAKEGKIPNIKKYFMDEGSFAKNSFTSLSLTVPSWSSILSGVDIHESGFKGNEIFNRQTKEMSNFLDWRVDICSNIRGNVSSPDLCDDKYRKHGRAYRKMKGLGHSLLIDYYNHGDKRSEDGLIIDDYGDDSEVFMSFFPLNNSFPEYLFGTVVNNFLFYDQFTRGNNFHNNAVKYLHEDLGFSALDKDNLEQAIKVIDSKKGKKKKIIGIYFASVDHYAHTEYKKGIQALIQADYLIGSLMKKIQRSRYRDSVVAIVGDHGSQGGKELALKTNHHHPLRGREYGLTGTNITYLLNGWLNIPELDQYQMNVTTSFPVEGPFSLWNIKNFQVQAVQCTNTAYIFRERSCDDTHNSNPDNIHAGVTTSQTISLPYKDYQGGDWSTPNNWYSLTNYIVGQKDGVQYKRNLIKDFEYLRALNIKAFNKDTKKLIGNKPLDWLALSVSAQNFLDSPIVKKLTLKTDPEQRVIIIHAADDEQALILTDTSSGTLKYKYLPIKNFSQTQDGTIDFLPNFTKDPFGYFSIKSDYSWYKGFHTQRAWTEKFKNTVYPNTVSALWKLKSFSGTAKALENDYSIDLVLSPNYGHIFEIENEELDVNHRMFHREAVNHLFALHGPGIKAGHIIEQATFATDFLPTVLAALEATQEQRARKQFSIPTPYYEKSAPSLEGEVIWEFFE